MSFADTPPRKDKNMSEKKKVVFVCKTANLNIIKHKGATIVTAVPGGTKSEVTPTSWIKFREHKYITGNPEEIEIIRRHIEEYHRDGIMELVPKTPEDVLKEKEVKALEAMKELEEARELAGKVVEETPEPEEEKKVYSEKCPDCDWVAESFVSEAQMKNKLRGHRAGKHKK